jgi:carboxyl-terminal processing protease
MGERDVNNAMPWDKIDPTQYGLWMNNTNFTQAILNSKNRIAKNSQFQLVEDNAKWIDSRSEDYDYSLNIDKFRLAQHQIEEKAKKYKPLQNYKTNLTFSSLPYEKEIMKTDVALKEKRDRWHEVLAKDIYVEEAINILDDLQSKPIVKKSLESKAKSNNKLAKS